MRLLVLAAASRQRAPDDDAVSELVEDLRDRRVQLAAALAPGEGDSDEAPAAAVAKPREPPGLAAALVIERREQIPGPRGLVLNTRAAAPGPWSDELDRHRGGDALRLEHVMEVQADLATDRDPVRNF